MNRRPTRTPRMVGISRSARSKAAIRPSRAAGDRSGRGFIKTRWETIAFAGESAARPAAASAALLPRTARTAMRTGAGRLPRTTRPIGALLAVLLPRATRPIGALLAVLL